MSNTTSNANDRQVGGDHYKTGGTELWDLFGPESIIFYAVRYVQRWRKKDGVKDLEKALHCVQKLREIAPHCEMRNVLRVHDSVFEDWLIQAVKGAEEQTIIRRLVIWWKDDVVLEYAQRQIEYLIRKESQVKISLPDTKPLQEIFEEASDYLRDRSAAVKTSGTVKSKPYSGMTDTELQAEYDALDLKQSKATSWGAAVGVCHEYMQDIKKEQTERERRVPRFQHAQHGDENQMPRKNTRLSCDDGLCDDHAREVAFGTTPWVVDEDWLAKSEIGTGLIDRYWTKRAPHVYVLDPYVKCDNIPRTLRHCYNLRGDGNWTLDVRKCPPETREYFPSLPLSQNTKEWEERAEWQRVLYVWDEAESKYKLSDFTGAWHVEEEVK